MTAHLMSAAATPFVESADVYEDCDEATLLLLLEYDGLNTNLA